jgi:hypothetical protein
MYTTIRHEIHHTRKGWPGTLLDPCLFSAAQRPADGVFSCCYLLNVLYTTIRHELRHARKGWPGTLVDTFLLSAAQLPAEGIFSCWYLLNVLYTTIRHELRYARKGWSGTLVDPCLLSAARDSWGERKVYPMRRQKTHVLIHSFYDLRKLCRVDSAHISSKI